MFKGVVTKFGLLVACTILVLMGSMLMVTLEGLRTMSRSVEKTAETILDQDTLHKNLRDKKAAEEYGKALAQYLAWVTTSPLWNYNEDSLQGYAEGMLKIPHVACGAIYDDSGSLVAGNIFPGEDIVLFGYPVTHRGLILGSVKVGLNISYLERLRQESDATKGTLVTSFRDETAREQKKITTKTFFLALTIALGASLGLIFLAMELQRRAHAAQQRIQESEKKFRTVFNTAPYGISVLETDEGSFLEVNHAFGVLFGHGGDELRGKNLWDLGITPDKSDLEHTLEMMRKDRVLANVSRKILRASGEERRILYSMGPLGLGEKNLAIITMVDVTEQHHLSQNNAKLQEQIKERSQTLKRLDTTLKKRQIMVEKTQHQLRLLNKSFEHISEGIFTASRNRYFLSINPAFTAITGYTLGDVEHKPLELLRDPQQPREFYEDMEKKLRHDHYWEGELWGRRKNGEIYPLFLILTAFTNEKGHLLQYIGVLQDRSEIHESREQLEYETLHDSLTGLPNRLLFLDRLAMACQQAEEYDAHLAVMLLGLDRFDTINRSLGYGAGDNLLRECARRLKSVLPEEGTLARFGGDEFVLYLPFPENLRQPLRTAEELIRSIRKPFSCEGREFHITASAGISIFPQDAATPEDLLKNTSLALGRAKKENRDWYQLYTQDMNEQMQLRYNAEMELRQGIANREFFMYYQPKIHVDSGKVVGMEALMRWIRPGKGIVSPVLFIPLAEEMGEIIPLGEFALTASCDQTRKWNRHGAQQLRVAVNVSPKQFADDTFAASVLRAMEKAELDPAFLELEITENVFMDDLPRARKIMERLRKEGVRFSLDDFGTGYSSLSYVHHLPLSGIKIDRSLTFDLHLNPNTRAVISTLHFMARELNFELTVEGVENREQLDFVRTLGKDTLVQGYFFSPPLSPEDFLEYLRQSPEKI